MNILIHFDEYTHTLYARWENKYPVVERSGTPGILFSMDANDVIVGVILLSENFDFWFQCPDRLKVPKALRNAVDVWIKNNYEVLPEIEKHNA